MDGGTIKTNCNVVLRSDILITQPGNIKSAYGPALVLIRSVTIERKLRRSEPENERFPLSPRALLIFK